MINQQHRDELIEELDSAFRKFLSDGERALPAILASPNQPNDFIRSSSSVWNNQYLQSAIDSAFIWLYYWSILKPISTELSFHIGYSFTLGMLRALGIEPVSSLPKGEHDLELDAIFIGSPMTFVKLCRELLGLIWLPKSSLTLTWQLSPDQIIRSPKHFLEFMNLHIINKC